MIFRYLRTIRWRYISHGSGVQSSALPADRGSDKPGLAALICCWPAAIPLLQESKSSEPCSPHVHAASAPTRTRLSARAEPALAEIGLALWVGAVGVFPTSEHRGRTVAGSNGSRLAFGLRAQHIKLIFPFIVSYLCVSVWLIWRIGSTDQSKHNHLLN